MLALKSAAAWYSRALDTSPLLARILGTVPILVAADAVSQASDDQPWNWRKTIGMGMYGAIWVAPVSYYWFRFLANRITIKSPIPNLITTVAVDAAVMSPLFLCAFMTTRGIIEKQSKEEIARKIRSDTFTMWTYSISFWLPVSVFNFWMVPLKFRVIYMNGFSFLWNTFLVMRTRFEKKHVIAAPALPSAASDPKHPSIAEELEL